ncbi:monooxygenase [Fomitopsis betulina]|nr:monooxygenase [Fomitopsis betulina]
MKPMSPVLVAGAGPAGLATRAVTRAEWCPVRIINKASTPHQEFLSLNVDQPRSADQPVVFYKLPAGTEVLETTSLSVFEEDTPTKPFNNTYQIAQYQTEAVLRSHLERYGCFVEFSTELVGLSQHEDHVKATIKKSVGGNEEIEAQSFRWLIGADGGKSVVRKQSGFAFEGTAPEQRGILGEMNIEGLDTELWHAWLRNEGGTATIVMLCVVEGRRFFFMILGHPDPDKLLSSHKALKEGIIAHTDRSDIQMGHVYYVSDYRPSVRVVDKFSEGRVFLVGDAAHVHAPRGGQGLNSSVQDAFNLGWKLALVEQRLAPRALLATYSEERLPVIQRMLQETTVMRQRGKDAQPPQAARHQLRWSSIVFDERAPRAVDEEREPYGVEGEDTLKAGDRAPDATGLVRVSDSRVTSLFHVFSPTRHTVLILGGDRARIESIVKTVARYPKRTVSAAVVLPSGDKATTPVDGTDATLRDGDTIAYDAYCVADGQTFAFIVRPDGVVGAIVSGEAGVVRYFSGIFSPE